MFFYSYIKGEFQACGLTVYPCSLFHNVSLTFRKVSLVSLYVDTILSILEGERQLVKERNKEKIGIDVMVSISSFFSDFQAYIYLSICFFFYMYYPYEGSTYRRIKNQRNFFNRLQDFFSLLYGLLLFS